MHGAGCRLNTAGWPGARGTRGAWSVGCVGAPTQHSRRLADLVARWASGAPGCVGAGFCLSVPAGSRTWGPVSVGPGVRAGRRRVYSEFALKTRSCVIWGGKLPKSPTKTTNRCGLPMQVHLPPFFQKKKKKRFPGLERSGCGDFRNFLSSIGVVEVDGGDGYYVVHLVRGLLKEYQ